MTKDTMLGRITQLIAGLPLERLGVVRDIAEKLSSKEWQDWLAEFKKFLRKKPCWTGASEEVQRDINAPIIADWQNFYREHFAMNCNFSQIHISEKPEGNWRMLIIADVSLEQLYARCEKLFSCWRWTGNNLDKEVIWNERDAKNGAYAIWVKDVQESDEDLKNLSANGIKTKGIKTETLAERLIHELKFFEETGKHLDVSNVTLCAGSCVSVGLVPFVYWRVDRLVVRWYYSAPTSDCLRSREVVS